MSLWKESICPSSLLISLSYGIVFQSEGGVPSRCTQWSSHETSLTARSAPKEDIGILVIAGSPLGGISP